MQMIPLDFIDVSNMAAALLMRHKSHFTDETRRQTMPGSPHHDTKTIILRGPETPSPENWFLDVPQVDSPLLHDWPSARQVIEAIAASHLRRTGEEPNFGKIMVVSLKPFGWVDWHVDMGPYAEAYNRMHCCLVPSPGAWLYSGGEAAILPMGQLTYFNNRTLHSALNMGPIARVHLICDVRMPAKIGDDLVPGCERPN